MMEHHTLQSHKDVIIFPPFYSFILKLVKPTEILAIFFPAGIRPSEHHTLFDRNFIVKLFLGWVNISCQKRVSVAIFR